MLARTSSILECLAVVRVGEHVVLVDARSEFPLLGVTGDEDVGVTGD